MPRKAVHLSMDQLPGGLRKRMIGAGITAIGDLVVVNGYDSNNDKEVLTIYSTFAGAEQLPADSNVSRMSRTLSARKDALKYESTAIGLEHAAISAEKAAINELICANPQHPEIKRRQQALTTRKRANERRGAQLGWNRQDLKEEEARNAKNVTKTTKRKERKERKTETRGKAPDGFIYTANSNFSPRPIVQQPLPEPLHYNPYGSNWDDRFQYPDGLPSVPKFQCSVLVPPAYQAYRLQPAFQRIPSVFHNYSAPQKQAGVHPDRLPNFRECSEEPEAPSITRFVPPPSYLEAQNALSHRRAEQSRENTLATTNIYSLVNMGIYSASPRVTGSVIVKQENDQSVLPLLQLEHPQRSQQQTPVTPKRLPPLKMRPYFSSPRANRTLGFMKEHVENIPLKELEAPPLFFKSELFSDQIEERIAEVKQEPVEYHFGRGGSIQWGANECLVHIEGLQV